MNSRLQIFDLGLATILQLSFVSELLTSALQLIYHYLYNWFVVERAKEEWKKLHRRRKEMVHSTESDQAEDCIQLTICIDDLFAH